MDEATQKALRALPAVEELLSHPAAAPLLGALLRGAGGRGRAGGAGGGAAGDPGGGAASGAGAAWRRRDAARPARPPRSSWRRRGRAARAWRAPGCGRCSTSPAWSSTPTWAVAALAERAVERVVEVARSYSNLEYDLEAGAAGSRETHVEALLTRLTGAEAAFAVNNNAGAVLLLLMALAPAARCWCRAGNWWRSAGRSACPTSCGPAASAWWRWGPPTAPASATTKRPSPPTPPCCCGCTPPTTASWASPRRRSWANWSSWAAAGACSWPTTWAAAPCTTRRLPGRAHRGRLAAGRRGRGLLQRRQAAGRSAGRASCWAGARSIDRLRKHPVARALRLDKMTLAALEATLRALPGPRAGAPGDPDAALL